MKTRQGQGTDEDDVQHHRGESGEQLLADVKAATVNSLIPDPGVPNATSRLATAINTAHAAVTVAVRSGHALCAGDLLMQAKTGVPNGAWLLWLTKHCPSVSDHRESTCSIARRWAALEALEVRTKYVDALADLLQRDPDTVHAAASRTDR